MYTKEIIVKKTIELISTTLDIPKEKVSMEAKLVDLTADSIQLFELIIGFEKLFDVKTEYEDIIRIETPGDIVEYLVTLVEVGTDSKEPVSKSAPAEAD